MPKIIVNRVDIRELFKRGTITKGEITVVLDRERVEGKFTKAKDVLQKVVGFVNSGKTQGDKQTQRNKFMEFISSKINCDYAMGATGVGDKFDCSGLIKCGLDQLCYPSFPRVSTDQYLVGESVPPADVQRGDLIFFKTEANARCPNHVGIVTKKGHMINANSYYKKVVEESFETNYWKQRFIGFKRIFPV